MKKARSYVSPKREAQAAETREAILEAFVEHFYPNGVAVAAGPDDLPRYFLAERPRPTEHRRKASKARHP